MRIWSKDLIKVLPTKQLRAMRYELGDMIKQYPNIKHPLVKFANNYDIAYLGQYFGAVCDEFNRRKLNHYLSYDFKILSIVDSKTEMSDEDVVDMDLRFDEDNDVYLTICGWNLFEKNERGMIPGNEWQKVLTFLSKYNGV